MGAVGRTFSGQLAAGRRFVTGDASLGQTTDAMFRNSQQLARHIAGIRQKGLLDIGTLTGPQKTEGGDDATDELIRAQQRAMRDRLQVGRTPSSTFVTANRGKLGGAR